MRKEPGVEVYHGAKKAFGKLTKSQNSKVWLIIGEWEEIDNLRNHIAMGHQKAIARVVINSTALQLRSLYPKHTVGSYKPYNFFDHILANKASLKNVAVKSPID